MGFCQGGKINLRVALALYTELKSEKYLYSAIKKHPSAGMFLKHDWELLGRFIAPKIKSLWVIFPGACSDVPLSASAKRG